MVVVAVVAVSLAAGAFFFSRPAPKPAAAQTMKDMAAHLPPGPEPGWLKGALQPVKDAYTFAAVNHDTLQYIPCYCGCGPDHKDNSSCYYRRDNQGTATAYEQHAYG